MKKINKKNSKEFSKNLLKIMKERNLTQMQLVNLFSRKNMKVPQSTISDWFNKGNLPRDTTFEMLCKILDVKETDLIPEESPLTDFTNVVKFKYPILGTIACGTPTESFEDDGTTFVVSDKNIHVDYALIARGDSMIDFGIKDGYFVFIKNYKDKNGKMISEVKNGDIAVVRVNGETTLKKIHFDKKTKTVTLIPGNPKYQPLVYSENDVTEFNVIGKAIYFQGMIK